MANGVQKQQLQIATNESLALKQACMELEDEVTAVRAQLDGEAGKRQADEVSSREALAQVRW